MQKTPAVDWGENGAARGWRSGEATIDLPVDKQEVSHQAQQGGHSGGNCQVALKVVLETHKEGCLLLRGSEGPREGCFHCPQILRSHG